MDDADPAHILERLAEGDLTVEEARDRLRGIARTGGVARVDVDYEARLGVPEVVAADHKTDDEVVSIAGELLSGAGRVVVAGPSDDARDRIDDLAAVVDWHERSGALVARAAGFEPPESRGTVGVVTAGTSDVAVAEEAVVLAGEMGCTVETAYDVGVASLHRLLPEVDRLDECDCVVVAAGREGALATVVAGLVSAPVIGLPVSTGTGYGGGGEAALMGMLQSCTPLCVVNIDAGFVAGAQAGRIAR